MRPRGYSNSVRQPLFCISGPTQLPSQGPKLYTSFFLSPFLVAIFRRFDNSLPSLFSSYYFYTFFSMSFSACSTVTNLFYFSRLSRARARDPQQLRIDSIQIRGDVPSYLSPQAHRLPSRDPIDFMLRKDGGGGNQPIHTPCHAIIARTDNVPIQLVRTFGIRPWYSEIPALWGLRAFDCCLIWSAVELENKYIILF